MNHVPLRSNGNGDGHAFTTVGDVAEVWAALDDGRLRWTVVRNWSDSAWPAARALHDILPPT